MKYVRRALEILRERLSITLLGSALWWAYEHFLDENLGSMIRSFWHFLR